MKTLGRIMYFGPMAGVVGYVLWVIVKLSGFKGVTATIGCIVWFSIAIYLMTHKKEEPPCSDD